jgi:hypothetical protein
VQQQVQQGRVIQTGTVPILPSALLARRIGTVILRVSWAQQPVRGTAMQVQIPPPASSTRHRT